MRWLERYLTEGTPSLRGVAKVTASLAEPELEVGGLNYGQAAAYRSARLASRLQAMITCPLLSTTVAVTVHFPLLRRSVCPLLGTFSQSVTSHAPSG